LYHLSWTSLYTEAIILHSNSSITDPEQAYLMRELVRFMADDSVGVSGYTIMPGEWSSLVDMTQNGASLNPRAPDINNMVAGWHQETRDLSLLLSRMIGASATVRLSRTGATDSESRIKKDAQQLCKNYRLQERLQIPDAVSDLKVAADLKIKTIRTSMEVNAPGDKKWAITRVRWLLRQLEEVSLPNVNIDLIWPSRSPNTPYALERLRENPAIVDGLPNGAVPRAFEVSYSYFAGRKFGGQRTFIQELESQVPRFFDKIGQHLKS
jgi:hypothetical protein